MCCDVLVTYFSPTVSKLLGNFFLQTSFKFLMTIMRTSFKHQNNVYELLLKKLLQPFTNF